MGCLTWNACSAYQLVLFEDGEVRWDGSQCVEKWGKRRFRIPQKKAVALFSRLAAAGIARLPGSYNDDCSAHLGVTTLYWSRGGERNRTQLVHWQCDLEAKNRGFIEAMSMVHDVHETTGTGSWPCENAGRRR